jgi:hypothetical protein
MCLLIMKRVEYSLHDMRASNENLRTAINASQGGMRAVQ